MKKVLYRLCCHQTGVPQTLQSEDEYVYVCATSEFRNDTNHKEAWDHTIGELRRIVQSKPANPTTL